MRILLRANGNVNHEAKRLFKGMNECDLYLSSLRRFSLTISYHAICVNTHINLFLPSQLADNKNA
jgi:hypothetical protein